MPSPNSTEFEIFAVNSVASVPQLQIDWMSPFEACPSLDK